MESGKLCIILVHMLTSVFTYTWSNRYVGTRKTTGTAWTTLSVIIAKCVGGRYFVVVRMVALILIMTIVPPL